jgi:hydroxymethylpyrimidine/phosphomethylpyrimidine kinase
VKIGMLGTAETVRAVTEALDLLDPETPIVLDPVMVAESGAVLLDEPARAAIIEHLLPRATVVTPNVPEARVLVETAGEDPSGEDGIATLARALHRLGPAAVVVTGGHREQATDVFFDGAEPVPIEGERYPDGAAHGSGCTHSSALAAHLALGHTPLEAARAAKRIASAAVRDGIRGLGSGPGPVDVLSLTRTTPEGKPRPRTAARPLA